MPLAAIHEVEGGRAFRRGLREAVGDLGDLRIVHGQAAYIAAEGVRRRVPDVSGRLKRTIRAAGTKTAAIVRAGYNRSAPYAPVIHWGWKKRNITPNPFATEGARDTEPRWFPLYVRYTEAAMDKIKGIA